MRIIGIVTAFGGIGSEVLVRDSLLFEDPDKVLLHLIPRMVRSNSYRFFGICEHDMIFTFVTTVFSPVHKILCIFGCFGIIPLIKECSCSTVNSYEQILFYTINFWPIGYVYVQITGFILFELFCLFSLLFRYFV